MDSGNNSSGLQSSSTGGGGGGGVGGDEEYNSRAASQTFSSSFHTQNSSSSSILDPFINFLDHVSHPRPQLPPPPPPQNNTATPISIYDLQFHLNNRRTRTDQTNNLMSEFNNSLIFDTTTGSITFPPTSQQHDAGDGNVSAITVTEQSAGAADPSIAEQARNPKKRSRASRKAPTTVLTTDANNFRAMVQEFTGIPGPPFAAPPIIPIRNRFDLFPTVPNSVAPTPIANNNPFLISQPAPNYLQRPFPQTIQPPPPYLGPPSSSSASAFNRLPINMASASSASTSATPPAFNYQLPSGVAHPLPINIASAPSTSTSATRHSAFNYQIPNGVANSVAHRGLPINMASAPSTSTGATQSAMNYQLSSGVANSVARRLPINIASAPSTSTGATHSAFNYQLSSGVANSVAHRGLPINIASAPSTSTGATHSAINYQLSSGVANLPINIASAPSASTSAAHSPTNYQLPSEVANSVAHGSNNFNSVQHNSIFTSLLQCSQKYQFGSKEPQPFQMPSNNIVSQFQMPSNSISQFQMTSSLNNSTQHGYLLSELPNLISEEQAATTSSRNESRINATNFHGDNLQGSVVATNFHGDNLQETVVATNFDGDQVQETVNPTDFDGDKVQETVSNKGVEGMVESWLLSTD